MELTQEKLKTGIKNQMQNFLEGVYLTWRYDPYAPGVGDMRMQDDARTPGINPYGAKYVMRPETENLFVADSASFEVGLKEMLKISQPIPSKLTTIKVGVTDIDKPGVREQVEKVLQEVNGWNEKGYSKVKVIYDDNATADLKKSLSKSDSEYKLAFTVDGAEPKIKNFNVDAKDFKVRDLHWMREHINKNSSAAPVVVESFISRTLDIANKTRIFEDLAKRQATYEEENGVYDAMNNSRCRENYAYYCLQKYIGYAGASKELEGRYVVARNSSKNYPFYQALGEIGPDGLRDLILQEHLRWNVTYLAEGIEFGPKKDLEGWETGRKTSPWIVSAEELWERSQKREKIPALDKEGVDYLAYTEDAIAVRKSMNYDLDGFADMCQDSRRILDRSSSPFARKKDDSNQTITSFATSFAPHFGKMCDDLNDAYKRGEEGLQRQKAQELEAQIEKLEAQKKELNQKISTPSL